MSESTIYQQWAAHGMEVSNTGADCWAAFTDLRGVRFGFADYQQSREPDPTKAIIVEAYGADSGEYLQLTQKVNSLDEALQRLPAWADVLQHRLNVVHQAPLALTVDDLQAYFEAGQFVLSNSELNTEAVPGVGRATYINQVLGVTYRFQWETEDEVESLRNDPEQHIRFSPSFDAELIGAHLLTSDKSRLKVSTDSAEVAELQHELNQLVQCFRWEGDVRATIQSELTTKMSGPRM